MKHSVYLVIFSNPYNNSFIKNWDYSGGIETKLLYWPLISSRDMGFSKVSILAMEAIQPLMDWEEGAFSLGL
jgi:hypothetical protein